MDLPNDLADADTSVSQDSKNKEAYGYTLLETIIELLVQRPASFDSS